MTVVRQKQTVFLLWGILFFVVLDQVSKFFARTSVGGSVCNDGIALSMPLPVLITIIASVCIIGLLIVWFVRHRGHALVERIGLALLIAGGIGNVIDRIIFGCVTDFVAFLDLWHFNIADAAIAAGIAAIMWHMIVVVPAYESEHSKE